MNRTRSKSRTHESARPSATDGRRHGAPSPRATSTRQEVIIDYPREGELAYTGGYTLRIGTVPEAMRVEVSFNGGPWLHCRESLGLWWFDWAAYAPGEYVLRARIHKERGVIVESAPRAFQVASPGSTPHS